MAARPLPKLTPAELAMDHKNEIIIPTVILTALATAAVVLRCVARRIRRTNLWWDDYSAFIALFFAYTTLTAVLLLLNMSTVVALEFFYSLVIVFYKLSILFLYHRIFAVSKFRWILKIFFALVIAWGVASMFEIGLQCRPLAHLWNPKIPGSCVNINAAFIGTAVGNIVVDVAMVILPMPLVWKLKITKLERLAICGIFALGSFVCISSIVRITSLVQFGLKDPTWGNKLPTIWSIVEPCCGIISACLPTFRPLFGLSSGRTSRPSHVDSDDVNSGRPGVAQKFFSSSSLRNLLRSNASRSQGQDSLASEKSEAKRWYGSKQDAQLQTEVHPTTGDSSPNRPPLNGINVEKGVNQHSYSTPV
ncbi:MAG: hypothetical protein M1825_000442 [Sarcosagium campestre]|nr:MAG: hypothetical protein M1825_000442 [Sarcosagium campestre]